jgi:hypothetical protein
MDDDVVHNSIGLSLERKWYSDLTSSKRLKWQFILSKKTWKPRSHANRPIYANKRRRPLEFEVGDHVYLRVSPMKGVKRFGVKGKLVPRYIGPFPILEKCGTVAYKLDLPPSLAGVHNIFHMP